jgi:hypothetical protein
MKFPLLTNGQLVGHVRDFNYDSLGRNIKLSVVPEGVFYTNAQTPKPLIKASGGQVRWENNLLSVSDMELVSKLSRLTLSFVVDNSSGQSILKRLRVKTSGADIAELHNYMSSDMAPEAVRKAYLNLIDGHQLSLKQGRVFGDLNWEAQGKSFQVKGAGGFYNVKAVLS